MDVIARRPCSRSCASNSFAAPRGVRLIGSLTARSPCRRTRLRCRGASSSRALGGVFVEDRVGVVDVDQHLARRRRQPVEPLEHAARRRSAAGGRCRARACCETPSADHLVVGPERAVDQHAVGALHRVARRAASIAPRPGRVERACGRWRVSVITRPMLSPGTGARGAANTAPACSPARSARQRTPATPSTANARRRRARCAGGRRRSSGRARAAPDCRASGPRRPCRCTRAASGAPRSRSMNRPVV